MGAIFGVLGGPIVVFTYPEHFRNLFGNINPAVFISIFGGAIWGGLLGAVIGTAVGLFLAWSKQPEFGSVIGLFLGSIIGIYLITLIAPNEGIGPLFLPLLGLIWGGYIGWGSGYAIERKANAH